MWTFLKLQTIFARTIVLAITMKGELLSEFAICSKNLDLVCTEIIS